MSKYYLKETRTYNMEPDAISIFLLDFDKDEYQWIITRNIKPLIAKKIYHNMMDGLISHVSFITHNRKNDLLSYTFDILTNDEIEEQLFLLGI